MTLIINCGWERKPELVFYQGLDGGAEIFPMARTKVLVSCRSHLSGKASRECKHMAFHFAVSQYGLHVLSSEDGTIEARSHTHCLLGFHSVPGERGEPLHHHRGAQHPSSAHGRGQSSSALAGGHSGRFLRVKGASVEPWKRINTP